MKGNKRTLEVEMKKSFEGLMLRNCPQKGITLIALIITIIVMLILVGVTINVALNGGLFTTAQTATKETQIEADREQLLSAVVASYEIETEVISKVKLISNLGDKWQVDGEGPYTVTSPKGNVFTVDVNGNITDESVNGGTSEGDNTVPEELAKYILGADENGRNLTEILDLDKLEFKQNPTDLESTIHENVKISYVKESEASFYIRYGRDVYKVKFEVTEGNVNTVKGSLEKVSSPEGNLGKYVTYEGKTWIVLYDDESKVELISADALGSVTLGDNTFDGGKTAYNSLIETLTDACKDETGITTGIRNVGGPAEDPETPTYVTLNDLKTKGFVPQTDKETEIESLIEGMKQEDENYLVDYNQMKALGILMTDTPEGYWLASRRVEVHSNDVYLYVFYIGLDDDILNDYDLYYVSNYGNSYGYSDSNAVRPVVTLTSGILDGKSGEGTRNNPINLD